jgi:multicomponent Na+:H+ antiporter subunit G
MLDLTLTEWLDAAGQVVIALGALTFATATIGLFRLPDLYSRSSAIATAAGVGVSLILTGVFLLTPGPADAVRLVVAVALQLITSAVGSMALARAAYLAGADVYSPTHHDDLADDADQLTADHEQ